MDDYTVSVSMAFENVDSPEEAVRLMIAWLEDNANVAGYRVCDIPDDAYAEPKLSVFIDAEELN